MAKKLKITEQEARAKATAMSEIVAEIRKKEAEMTAKINEVKEKFTKASENLLKAKDKLELELLAYAKDNPDIFPTDRKTVKWGTVVISKRVTPPKVNIARGMDWVDALDNLKKEGLTAYIRVVQEVDKEAIIRDTGSEDSNNLIAGLAAAGITVTQKERISVEVLEEELG